MSRPPDGIAISTPGDWTELDLSALGDRKTVESAVEARLAEAPELAEHRDDLVDILERAAASAARVEASFAAVLAADRDRGPMLANLTLVAQAVAADQPADGLNAREGSSGKARGGAPAHSPQSEEALPPEVREVQLGAGTAGRQEELRTVGLTGSDSSLLFLIVRYLIPIPNTPDVEVLTFTSPTIAHRRELVGLFHAIADSVAFRWETD